MCIFAKEHKTVWCWTCSFLLPLGISIWSIISLDLRHQNDIMMDLHILDEGKEGKCFMLHQAPEETQVNIDNRKIKPTSRVMQGLAWKSKCWHFYHDIDQWKPLLMSVIRNMSFFHQRPEMEWYGHVINQAKGITADILDHGNIMFKIKFMCPFYETTSFETSGSVFFFYYSKSYPSTSE